MKCYLFLILSLLYAVLAFFQIYQAAALISFLLGLLVESIRIRAFSFLPKELLDPNVSVVDKFHHASVLCLSLGLFIATFVLLNDTELRLAAGAGTPGEDNRREYVASAVEVIVNLAVHRHVISEAEAGRVFMPRKITEGGP